MDAPWSRSCAAALAALCLAASPGTALAEWVLDHEEVFAGRGELDRTYWDFERGHIRNREEQYYQERNVFVEGGVLVFEARREQVANAAWKAGSRDWRTSRRTAAYTSGAIVSRRPLHYARVEVVARSPSGAGVWPAIWLVHEGAVYGEIDMFEAVGKHPDTVFAAVHHGRHARTRKHNNASLPVPGFEGSWRTHSLEWTPDRIQVQLDGRTFFTFAPSEAVRDGMDPLRQPMHLHLNLALGGSWGGPVDDSRLPARFEVASIRVWRWSGRGNPAPAASGEPAARQSPPDSIPRWGR